MLKTSLHDEHLALGAKMAEFAGFDMPIQYSSVKNEVLAVRNNVGVFDVSHMGEFFVTGSDAVKFVDYIMTNDFAGAEIGKAVYSPLCRDNGTVIDDLIAYKLVANKVLICVNASNIQKDWAWISSKTEGFDINLENHSENYSLIAVQGPKTEEALSKLGLASVSKASYYSAYEDTLNGDALILARTGYTGEDGFEIFGSHDAIKRIWKSLLANGVEPCGLASRDVLRLEVCYPLYGHELSDEITPLDAALKWTTKLNKESFIAKAALTTYEPKFQLVKLSLDKGIPREGYEVLDDTNTVIGKVTSGTMSVVLEKGICLALIEKNKVPADKKFKIQIRKNILEANYHTKPFISGGHK
ncbi:glycine cleavage system aminomethyltransferase GcvT [Bacteriovorax sp. Seq25_V]|uniref:glycine cleavage system aminomethyltransferase GcvT n=1 Tax=Bacteriovorax sp. Seq25_V TaxID=1201288 RepID=UPI00038A042F|nr:glycine cleavage system aminomethyltransferase GcvT [Bacteriovorax sp. Seq25_V]EQC43310.1 aminomethyltransferase [Bacteriovorax sp. Seq25_V]